MARSGGGGDIATRISLDGGDEVKRQLLALGKDGEKALRDLNNASAGASKGLAELSNVSHDLQAVFGRLGGLDAVGVGAFSSITDAAKGMTTGLGAAAAGVVALTAAFGTLAVSGAHAASEIKEGATRVGVSAEDFTKLKFAFEQSGASAETFEKAMSVILDASDAAAAATKKAADAFQDSNVELGKTADDAAKTATAAYDRLGVKLLDTAGRVRNPANVFRDLADAIGKIEDPAERAAAVIGIFQRRTGPKLVEVLSEGSAQINKLGDEAVSLGLKFSDADLAVGKKFSDTLSKLGNTIGVTSAKVGLAFAGMFDGVGEALAASLGLAQAPIVAFANSIADTIKPIFEDIARAIAGDTDKINSQFIRLLIPTVKLFGQALQDVGIIVGGAFTVLKASFTQIAGLINDVFGTKVTAGDIPAFLIAFRLAVGVVSLLAAAFKVLTLGAAPWLIALAAVSAALLLVSTDTQTISEAIRKFIGEDAARSFNEFVETVRLGWENIKKSTDDAIKAIKPGIDDWARSWSEAIDRVITKYTLGLAPLLGLTKPVDFGGGGDFSGSDFDFVGRARGGFVRGPGSATSDSIRALLSDGEFVIQASAVKHFGVGLFDALNRLRTPKFSLGGLVEGLSRPLVPRAPRFASGGLVAVGAAAGGGRAPVHLHIGAEVFHMETDRATAGRVIRHAKRTAVLSAGRKPSHM